MPRPGPRPYECVRRAWHSDRHQPMRGSLIQEIFRIVNEIHSSATKKNKEWQDKLPLVVLKAEEIMYSKANSEAEYMDLKTLPDRANDAINTIIRRDEASESGELLPPCIEAALNLGCIPRRASRSQRNFSPRCYLSSSTQEASESSVGPKLPNNIVFRGSPHLQPPHSSNPLPNSSLQLPLASRQSCLQCAATANGTSLTPSSACPALQDKTVYCSDNSLMTQNFPQCWQDKSLLQKDVHHVPDLGHIQQMYYRVNNMESGFTTVQIPQVSNREAVIVVTPRVPPVVEADSGFLHNLLSCGNAQDARSGPSRASLSFGITLEDPADMRCDLSLRLGPVSTPCVRREDSWIVKDGASHSTSGRSKFYDHSFSKMATSQFGCSSSSGRIGKALSFFPLATIDEPLEPCSSK